VTNPGSGEPNFKTLVGACWNLVLDQGEEQRKVGELIHTTVDFCFGVAYTDGVLVGRQPCSAKS